MKKSQTLLSVMSLLGAPLVLSLLSATVSHIAFTLLGFLIALGSGDALGEHLVITLGAAAFGLSQGLVDFRTFLMAVF